MKKFWLGLLLGMALVIATAASLPEIKALLYPVHITFEENGDTTEFDGQVLNYENHLYIPVRSFAEHMGSTVEFTPPSYSGGKAKVQILKLDDENFTAQDAEHHVSIGLIEERDAEPLQITGAIKFNQAIFEQNQVVITLLDEDGNEFAASNPIRLDYRELDEMLTGEVSYFRTLFPVVELPESYSYGVRIEEKQAWTIRQEEFYRATGVLSGFPLAPLVDQEAYVPGKYFKVWLQILNQHETEKVVITEPFVLEVAICKVEEDGCEEVRTLKSEPFTGTINENRGSYVSHIIWDLKDSAGAPIPKGEYFVSLKYYTNTAYGHYESKPQEQREFELLSNMASAIGFYVE